MVMEVSTFLASIDKVPCVSVTLQIRATKTQFSKISTPGGGVANFFVSSSRLDPKGKSSKISAFFPQSSLKSGPHYTSFLIHFGELHSVVVRK